MKILLALQTTAHRLDERLIGQAAPRLKGARFKHIGSLGSCPPQELPCQPCLAYARFPLDGRYLHAPLLLGLQRRDARTVLGGAPSEWDIHSRPWRRHFL